jgi:hypothetical protein
MNADERRWARKEKAKTGDLLMGTAWPAAAAGFHMTDSRFQMRNPGNAGHSALSLMPSRPSRAEGGCLFSDPRHPAPDTCHLSVSTP